MPAEQNSKPVFTFAMPQAYQEYLRPRHLMLDWPESLSALLLSLFFGLSFPTWTAAKRLSHHVGEVSFAVIAGFVAKWVVYQRKSRGSWRYVMNDTGIGLIEWRVGNRYWD